MLRSSHGYLIEQCSPMVLSRTLIFHFSSAWLLCLLTDSEFRQGSIALLHTLTIYPSWTTPTLCSLLQTNSASTPGYPVWLSCSSSPDWSGRWGCAPIFFGKRHIFFGVLQVNEDISLHQLYWLHISFKFAFIVLFMIFWDKHLKLTNKGYSSFFIFSHFYPRPS